MREFLITGGITGMTSILLLGIAMLVVAFIEISRRASGKVHSSIDQKLTLSILFLGGFSILFGMFYQVLGLYQAYQFIQAAADISPSIVMNGVFISFYAPLFGLGVGLVSFVLWYVIKIVWGSEEK